MNVRCYTVQHDQVYAGINGTVLNIQKDGPVYATTIRSVRPSGYSGRGDLEETPWETAYTFTDCSDGAINRGGLVHLSLSDWIPCTDLGDNSILLESFNDGTGLLFMPRMAGLLKGNSNGLFLVSGNSGKPEIGLSGATGVLRRTFYKGVEQKPKPPNTPVSPVLSELVSSLRTYRDTLEPLPLPQAQVSTDLQDTSVPLN